MHVQRIGFTALKGARHVEHASVELADTGPVGDRAFALVDPARGCMLRTVENASLLRGRACWEGGVLSVNLAGSTLAGAPTPTGELLEVDYWGRLAQVEVVAGPWAAGYSSHLGYDVVLVRSVHAGEAVYGESVTLVSTSSISALESRLDRPVDSARFRSTFLVDTVGLEPHGEDSWVGRELVLGGARVRVRRVVPRCAVIDLDPETGLRDAPLLGTLAGYRQFEHEICFGVDAVVTCPGRVAHHDPVSLVPEGPRARRS